jgi:hypothetical protein
MHTTLDDDDEYKDTKLSCFPFSSGPISISIADIWWNVLGVLLGVQEQVSDFLAVQRDGHTP